MGNMQSVIAISLLIGLAYGGSMYNTHSMTSGNFDYGSESIETFDLFGANDVIEVDSSDGYNQDNIGIGYGQTYGSGTERHTMLDNFRKGSLIHNTYEPEASSNTVIVQ